MGGGGAAARAAARWCYPSYHPLEPRGASVGAGLRCQPPGQDGVPFPAANELDQRYASYFSCEAGMNE